MALAARPREPSRTSWCSMSGSPTSPASRSAAGSRPTRGPRTSRSSTPRRPSSPPTNRVEGVDGRRRRLPHPAVRATGPDGHACARCSASSEAEANLVAAQRGCSSRPTGARTSSWPCWRTSCATRWPPLQMGLPVLERFPPRDELEAQTRDIMRAPAHPARPPGRRPPRRLARDARPDRAAPRADGARQAGRARRPRVMRYAGSRERRHASSVRAVAAARPRAGVHRVDTGRLGAGR